MEPQAALIASQLALNINIALIFKVKRTDFNPYLIQQCCVVNFHYWKYCFAVLNTPPLAVRQTLHNDDSNF